MLGNWASSRRYIDPKPNRVRGHHDVAVQDGSIYAVSLYRLQRDVGSKAWLLNCIKDAARAADRSVLGQASAGLTHEPHGCVANFGAVSGSKKWIVSNGECLPL
jgi:hypothetical protein